MNLFAPLAAGLALGVGLLLAPERAGAEMPQLLATPFVEAPHSRVRLLARAHQDGRFEGAIEIRLDAGYKTYWRSPGDSGVPPLADFAPSQNLAGLRLAFPVPMRFADGAGGQSWGYHERILLPVSGTLTAKGEASKVEAWKVKAWHFAVGLDFAVCGKMCIPARADLALDPATAEAAEAEAQALAEAQARVPVPVALFSNRGGFGIRTLSVRRSDSEALLEAVVGLPETTSPEAAALDAFGEAQGFLDVLRLEPSGAGKKPAEVTLFLRAEPMPGTPGRFGPARLTLVFGAEAIETEFDLDALPGAP